MMPKYILNRLIYSLVTIFIVITVVFFLMRLLPGGPFDGDRVFNENLKKNLEAKFGLNKPLIQQYTIYLGNLLKGDLGPSMVSSGKTVNSIIQKSFPVSAKLGVVTIITILIAGINIGIISALNQNKFLDRFFYGTCNHWSYCSKFCNVCIFNLFSTTLRLLPSTGLSSVNHCSFWIFFRFVSRLMRSRLLDVLSEDYIKIAKAKGESAASVIFKHALKKCNYTNCYIYRPFSCRNINR